MGKIKVTKTRIEDLYIIEPAVFFDERGYFTETYNKQEMVAAGLHMDFVQDNESMSAKGVLRGLHYQKEHPQGKLVRVILGAVFDVAVDLRAGSPTFGQWYGSELSSENRKMLYIGPGFAHGFLVLSDTAVFSYKVTDHYRPDDEGGLTWDDPAIGIQWPGVTPTPEGWQLSDGTPLQIKKRDLNWPRLCDAFRF